MKKRNCRLTPAEREQHEQAVKFRRMTDEQICTCLKEAHASGYQEGYQQGKCDQGIIEMEDRHKGVGYFLSRLSCLSGTGIGIGPSTVAKLKEFAKKEGYIDG